jgi:hypothetical protein
MRGAKNIGRILVYTTSGLAFLGILSCIFGWAERERNKKEEYQVYSAYLSDGLLNDAHDWSTGGQVRVVIRDKTYPGGNLRFPLFYLFDGRANFGGLEATTRASYLARNLFQTQLESKFSLPSRATVSVVAGADYSSPSFERNFPGNMGLVVLSGVGFNASQTQAVFYVDHFCGLCGGGRYVLMEKVSGKWVVTDEHSVWIS